MDNFRNHPLVRKGKQIIKEKFKMKTKMMEINSERKYL